EVLAEETHAALGIHVPHAHALRLLPAVSVGDRSSGEPAGGLEPRGVCDATREFGADGGRELRRQRTGPRLHERNRDLVGQPRAATNPASPAPTIATGGMRLSIERFSSACE